MGAGETLLLALRIYKGVASRKRVPVALFGGSLERAIINQLIRTRLSFWLSYVLNVA